MDAGYETMRRTAHAVRSTAGKTPPRPVLWALLSLIRDAEPIAVAAEHTSTEKGSEWRVIALTDTILIVVEASAPVVDWTLETDGPDKPEGMEISARALPRSAVKCLEVADVAHTGAWSENDAWTAQWVIHCDDTEPFTLPASQRGEEDPSEQIALALLADL